jgi:hypothetical protein
MIDPAINTMLIEDEPGLHRQFDGCPGEPRPPASPFG